MGYQRNEPLRRRKSGKAATATLPSTSTLPQSILAVALSIICGAATALGGEAGEGRKVRMCLSSDMHSRLASTTGGSATAAIGGDAKAPSTPGYEIELVELPAKRCLREVERGRIDGSLYTSEASALTRNLALPPKLQDGVVVEERVSYSYAMLGSQSELGSRIQWDGIHLLGITNKIIALPKEGVSSIGDLVLRSVGGGDGSPDVRLIEPSESHAGLVRMLQAKRVDVIIGDTQQLVALQQLPGNEQLQVLSPPLTDTRVYAAFNQDFAQQHPEVVAAIWDSGSPVMQNKLVRLIAAIHGGSTAEQVNLD